MDVNCLHVLLGEEHQKIELIKRYCEAHGAPVDFIKVDTWRKETALPCVFNHWCDDPSHCINKRQNVF